MLDIILSHWAVYVYAAYVVVLLILCIVLRPKANSLYGSLRDLHFRARRTASQAQVRQFR